MTPRYNVGMSAGQPRLPLLWLLSDARNDGQLEAGLAALPQGSGFVFRHYHLGAHARRERFAKLCGIARSFGHTVIVAGDGSGMTGDGVYGPPERLPQDAGLRLATAHDGDQISQAIAAGVDGIFLSPVFPTRSHPGAPVLGIQGFHVLAQQSPLPVIALGGMTRARARDLDWPRWGAIDGLAQAG